MRSNTLKSRMFLSKYLASNRERTSLPFSLVLIECTHQPCSLAKGKSAETAILASKPLKA